MVCASFTEEQKQKIINRKRYVEKDKAGVSDISKDESEFLGEPDQGDIFEGSQQELEQAAQSIYQSPPKPSNVMLGDPRARVLGLDNLSLRISQHPLTIRNPKNRADLPLSKGTSPVIEIRKNQNKWLPLLYIGT